MLDQEEDDDDNDDDYTDIESEIEDDDYEEYQNEDQLIPKNYKHEQDLLDQFMVSIFLTTRN